jgi:hypothetical protein
LGFFRVFSLVSVKEWIDEGLSIYQDVRDAAAQTSSASDCDGVGDVRNLWGIPCGLCAIARLKRSVLQSLIKRLLRARLFLAMIVDSQDCFFR